ncbi:MAG: PilZ domain-containing protein [Thermodesulfobacteriota bacterium]|nr:PilZ domain-containing protein [Thermodesulfobacteriota bacterium]
MTQEGNTEERRRDYRIPMDLPVHLTPLEDGGIIQGRLQDLSRSGAQAETGEPLAVEDAVRIDVRFDEVQAPVELPGTVRWCRAVEGRYRIGVRFREAAALSFPLGHVARICSILESRAQAPPNGKGRWHLLARSIQEFQPQTYWGTLFWVLSDMAQARFSRAAGQVGLCAFRLERLVQEWFDRSLNDRLGQAARQVLEDMDETVSGFKAIATIFRNIKEKQISENRIFTYTVDLDALIEESVASFSENVARLANRRPPPVKYDRRRFPLVYGRSVDFSRCLDTLLLFAYQTLLYGKGSSLIVTSEQTDEFLGVLFSHDASQILGVNELEMNALDPGFVAGLSPRDLRLALWLHLGLLPVHEYGASLRVLSESGRNRIMLRLPRRNAAP